MAKSATRRGIPLLGVNIGTMGFMAELESTELDKLALLGTDSFTIESRRMLDVTVQRVLMCFLPTSWNYKLASLERYSFLILIALMMTPFFTYILIPLQRLVFALFSLILAPFL